MEEDSNQQPITVDDINSFTDSPPRKEPPWQTRKRTVFATLVFCALCIGYILLEGKDLAIYQTIALGCFGLAGSTLGFFIGGQTWHDINIEKIAAVKEVRQREIGRVSALPQDTDER